MKDNEQGLVMKYFVLKPTGSTPYHRASRDAMRAYADSIGEHNRSLAEELHKWADREAVRDNAYWNSPSVVEGGERFSLPFWVDDIHWAFSRMRNQARTKGGFVCYLYHIESGLEAHTNEQISPWKACVQLREIIEKELRRRAESE